MVKVWECIECGYEQEGFRPKKCPECGAGPDMFDLYEYDDDEWEEDWEDEEEEEEEEDWEDEEEFEDEEDFEEEEEDEEEEY